MALGRFVNPKSTRSHRRARLLGSISLALTGVSAAFPIIFVVGDWILWAFVALSLCAFLAFVPAIVAVTIRRSCLAPQPARPLMALFMASLSTLTYAALNLAVCCVKWH